MSEDEDDPHLEPGEEIEAELVPDDLAVPAYLTASDAVRIEARRCWVIEMLRSAEGVLPKDWRKEAPDLEDYLDKGRKQLAVAK